MSVEHLAAVLNHSRAKGTAKLVLLGIANHQGDGGAWPTHETLARYANVDERNVRRAITKLVSSGELVVYVQAGGTLDWEDSRRPNRYEVKVTCPQWCDRSPNHRDTRKLAGRQLALPGVIPRGGASAPPGGALPPPVGGALPPPKPSTQPPTTGSSSTTGHARAYSPPLDWRPCGECAQPQRVCESRQTKLRPEDQHHYRPGTSGVAG